MRTTLSYTRITPLEEIPVSLFSSQMPVITELLAGFYKWKQLIVKVAVAFTSGATVKITVGDSWYQTRMKS